VINLYFDIGLNSWHESVSEYLSLFIVFIGVVFLLGWIFNIPLLLSPDSSFSTIKSNAVFGFILIGMSLWFIQNKRLNSINRRIAQILAFLTFLIGFITFLEYLFDMNLFIDQFLFKESIGAVYTVSPNRMAFTATISLMLAGIAVLFLDTETKRGHRPAQYITLIIGLISFLALVGYAYNVSLLYYIPYFTSMAIYAAATLFIICISLLFARPDKGFMKTFTGKYLGSKLLPRLLLPSILLILVLGWLWLQGLQIGFYSARYDTALLVSSAVIILFVMIWRTAILLNKVDIERRIAMKELKRAHDKLDLKVQERTKELTREILKKNESEQALKKSEERFRMLFKGSNAVMILIDPDSGDIADANPSAADFYGFSLDKLRTMNIEDINQLTSEEIREAREIAKKGGQYFIFPHKLANNEIRSVEVFSSPIQFGDKIVLFSIINDITERLKSDDALKLSLKEKEVLLKEIHHRVKNNLQIISSLLDLQEIYVKEDPKAVNVLKESQNRVLSMAMIHEMLYQSKDINRINFSDYTRNLFYNLWDSYGIKNTIKSSIDIDEIFLNIETSIPLGLIISELVSNSLKYAFPDDESGEICISLKKVNDEFELIISDDGVGFPEDVDFTNVESSLGLQLVNSLVGQLNGSIKLDKSHGTRFTIQFAELKYKERI
jgi:PAS domain S-box-containing protein